MHLITWLSSLDKHGKEAKISNKMSFLGLLVGARNSSEAAILLVIKKLIKSTTISNAINDFQQIATDKIVDS